MSFTDEVTKLETWWHEFISKLFEHPQAAQVAHPAIAAVATAAQPTQPATVVVPGTTQEISPVMANLLGVNQKTSDILNSRVGQSNNDANAPAGGIFRDGIVRYFHHTEVTNGATVTTEALKGHTFLELSYTGDQADKETEPTQAWASIDGKPEEGPKQCGVEAKWDLGDSGTHTAVIRFDTNGRMIGQLVNG